jgi:hypothetical protein
VRSDATHPVELGGVHRTFVDRAQRFIELMAVEGGRFNRDFEASTFDP